MGTKQTSLIKKSQKINKPLTDYLIRMEFFMRTQWAKTWMDVENGRDPTIFLHKFFKSKNFKYLKNRKDEMKD